MVFSRPNRVEIRRIKASEILVFVDGECIGEIIGDAFVQKATRRHLFRKLNSKGIEYDVYQRLLHEPVKYWRLKFTDIKQIMSIPLNHIPECAILNPPDSAGYQYHVKMQYFNVDQPALQKEMFLPPKEEFNGRKP